MKPIRHGLRWIELSVLCLAMLIDASALPAQVPVVRSHPAMRPLPTPVQGELVAGPKRFVDAVRGNDQGLGTEQLPWKSLRHAVRQLQPGETLYVRQGIYYEHFALTRSGTADKPITIAAYPGELPIIHGGLREFMEQPDQCWQPIDSGVPGEFVSTQTFPDADARIVPTQFLPGSWEPMWGIENDRPLALGHFADTLVPLHGYRFLSDLRANNELWIANKQDRETGLYAGPGLWFNRETGRIHIRLVHHQLAGLGNRAYRGENDPRKLPLVMAVGFGEDVLRITGIQHVRLSGLMFIGATGSPMINMYGSHHVELDHVTVYGGFPGLMISASQDIKVLHSAFRGLAAPWISRAHMKYRGTPTYQIILQNGQPLNQNIEMAHCEFTDDHDFAFVRWVKNLQFHHNLVDNFNDDGLECGAKLRDHTIYIYQNRIGGVLIPFTQHDIHKDESPLDHDPNAGVFIYRNVIDLRAGSYTGPPTQPDPSGDYLRQEGHLASDHGSPTWPIMHVYHNTLIRNTPIFRDNYMFGLGAAGLRHTERDVFNNIFVQTKQVPGVNFVAMTQAGPMREGGNLLWGYEDGPKLSGDPFAKFRASAVFKDSQKYYEPGWTTHDRIADPKFTRFPTTGSQSSDLTLQPDSPAINSGVPVPAAWPDPLRAVDDEEPDSGAIPFGTKPWMIGIDNRINSLP